MSMALLQTALLLPLEATLNGVVALDAASHARLAAIEGKTLKIACTAPAVALYLSVRAGKLRLSPLFDGAATATLAGPATALLRLLLQGSTPASLAPMGLELQGSTSFVQSLQQLLRDLDIDWEFHLSRLIGDLPVAAMSKGLDSGLEFAGRSVTSVRENLEDYFTYESSLLPARSALEQFDNDVMDLQLRIDRLQARLNQLAN